MVITPHLLAGSAVAVALTDNWFWAFLIGIAVHFILDAIPHVDPGTFFNIPENVGKSWPLWIYLYAVSEFIIIWAVVIILFQNNPNFAVIMAGGIGGIAIDILDNNPFRSLRTLPIIKQIHYLHDKIHFNISRDKWYWGTFSQIIVITFSLWFLLK